MCYLQPLLSSDIVEHSILSSQSQPLDKRDEHSPIITLGGYSYGSLIVKHLAPIPTMIQSFASPLAGSAADEIRLRARKLADQSNLEWINLASDLERGRETVKKGYKSKLSVSMGGEETRPNKWRSSREARMSVEGSRTRDVEHKLRSLNHKAPRNDAPQMHPEDVTAPSVTMPKIRYLLISPLTPPISTLAAPALGAKFWSRSEEGSQEVIGKHPSLAVYGDQDIFASARKTRDWAENLKTVSGLQFTNVEVEGAGHFWVEQGVEEQLRSALRSWETEIRM